MLGTQIRPLSASSSSSAVMHFQACDPGHLIEHVLCSLISDLQRKVDTASLKIILALWKKATGRPC